MSSQGGGWLGKAAGRPGNGNPLPPPPPAGSDVDPGPLGADLRNALRTRAERIPLRALERRGFRNVQVLDMVTIEKIVAEAVTHMLERHTAILTTEDRAKVEAEARQEFVKLLSEHKRDVAEKTETEKRREELDRQVQGLREELERQIRVLTAERDRHIEESTFSISPASFNEMEDKIRHLFEHLVSKERRLSLAEAGPKALAGLSDLEREVAAFLDRLLESERERFLKSVRKGHNENIDVLEKRVAKLNKALAETEDALRRVAEAKAGDPGIASIYESIQGLSPLDAYYAKKKELLEVIFQENLALQSNKPKHRGLAAGAAAATAVAAPAVEKLSIDFEPPLDPVTEETAF